MEHGKVGGGHFTGKEAMVGHCKGGVGQTSWQVWGKESKDGAKTR